MKEKEQVFGVLTGLVMDESGTPFIAIDVSGRRVALSPRNALLLFDQLGNMLEAVGMFEENYDELEKEEHMKCH